MIWAVGMDGIGFIMFVDGLEGGLVFVPGIGTSVYKDYGKRRR